MNDKSFRSEDRFQKFGQMLGHFPVLCKDKNGFMILGNWFTELREHFEFARFRGHIRRISEILIRVIAYLLQLAQGRSG